MYALSYLLAVSIVTQEPAAAALDRVQAALPQVGAQLQAANQALVTVRVEGLARLDVPGDRLRSLSALTDLRDPTRGAWSDQDPGDSLYRAGQRLLNRGRYSEAADAFAQLIKRYPRSDYAADAYYWQAFALYKTGDGDNYKVARRLLESQKARFSRAATSRDAENLYWRIQGELARQGDPIAAESVRVRANQPIPSTSPTPSTSPNPPSHAGADRQGTQAGCRPDDEADVQATALNALLQMDAESAVPILKRVLARRDACSVELRRKAVFILSQKRTPETEDVLLDVVRNDPDPDVREQGVFWLSQVGSERAVNALDSILHSASDLELRKKALFSLSQIHGPRASQTLRDIAQQGDAPAELREQAIFWLGQQHGAENDAFLRELYGRLTDEDLKDKVIFSLSQSHSEENARWLLDLALNERESIDVRKKALFWAGQSGADLTGLVSLYDRTSNEEMKEQLIFVYSQRHEPEAVTKLIDIAQHESNADLRKKAVFWLGQSHDPRARQALIDIINQ